MLSHGICVDGDYIVLPMLGSTVRKMLTQFGVEMFDEEDACSVSKQVAEGLSCKYKQVEPS